MGIHVSLPSEMETMIHAKVKTGMYGSASEVVRAALRDFFEEDAPSTTSHEADISDENFLKFFAPLIKESEAVTNADLISWDELQVEKNQIKSDFLDEQ